MHGLISTTLLFLLGQRKSCNSKMVYQYHALYTTSQKLGTISHEKELENKLCVEKSLKYSIYYQIDFIGITFAQMLSL